MYPAGLQTGLALGHGSLLALHVHALGTDRVTRKLAKGSHVGVDIAIVVVVVRGLTLEKYL